MQNEMYYCEKNTENTSRLKSNTQAEQLQNCILNFDLFDFGHC